MPLRPAENTTFLVWRPGALLPSVGGRERYRALARQPGSTRRGKQMRLALFGATGRAILRQACAAGCEVHALTRSPGKLSRDDPQVTVTAGDARDLAATGRAVQGADAVVSAIGGTCPGNPAVLQQGTAAILTAMNRRRRLRVRGCRHSRGPGPARLPPRRRPGLERPRT